MNSLVNLFFFDGIIKHYLTLIERQRDKEKEEWKYLVRGQTIDGSVITSEAKSNE